MTSIPADPISDPGGETQERFRYQAACALRLALEILADEEPTYRVYVERLEDALIERNDGRLVPVSVKSRREDQEPYGLGDTSFYKPLARFAIHEKHLGNSAHGYIWATSSPEFRPGLKRFFDGGLAKLQAQERAELEERVINAAKGFKHDISAADVAAAAAKVQLVVLDPLLSYEAILVSRVAHRIPAIATVPHDGLRERVREAIRLVEEMARAEFDFLLPRPAEVRATLDGADIKRIDAARLHALLGFTGSWLLTREERVLTSLGQVPQHELTSACNVVGAGHTAYGLARGLMTADPDTQVKALLQLKSRERPITLAETVRRLSMHSGGVGVSYLRSWGEAREPCCLVLHSVEYPWFAIELVSTAQEELNGEWIYVALDRELLAIGDEDEQIEAARAEICARLDVRDEELEDVVEKFEIRVVLTISARAEVSEIVERLVVALPACFVIVEAAPQLSSIGACADYPTPLETLAASNRALRVLERVRSIG